MTAQHITIPAGALPGAPVGAVPLGSPNRGEPTAPTQTVAPAIAPVPAPQGGFTQADIDAAVQRALSTAKPASVAPVPSTPVVVDPTAGVRAGTATFVDDGVGDPVVNSMTKVFLSVGSNLDMDRAFGKAITHGDARLIDAAYIREKGGANAEQLLTLAEGIVTSVNTQTQKSTEAIYATAGGKPAWDAAVAAFNAKAPNHIKQVVAQLMNSGNAQSAASAAQTVVDYARTGGLVSTLGEQVQAGGGVNSAQGISKEDFQAAVFKLDKNSRNYMADRNALYARRRIGTQSGI